jgi:cytochrome c-type biogenesis protein CcmH/NrfF
MRRLLPILALITALLAVTAPAQAAGRASLTDIEDEVMCPICGTLLELSQSPQADRERVFIRRLIARGESKQQIKDALVAEYGQEVLATPSDSGFDLTAYWVPIAALIAAAVAIALAVRRWRRKGSDHEDDERSDLSPEERKRLDSEMARYDL